METTSNLYPREGEEAQNSRVRLFLRIILGLAFAGLFVAGALSVSKIWDLGLPCGAAHGCDLVNSHPSSKWFGIPVAYIGFLGYVLITGLAVARSAATPEKARPLALGGYLLSAFGALTSVALQIYSLTVIQATCLWCLTSAALMVLLLVFHALEYGDRVSEDVPTGRGEFVLVSGLAVVVALGLVGFTMNLKKSSYRAPQLVSKSALEKTELVPKDAHVFGDKDSPVTIVEFADLMCPMCQQNSPKVKEFVAKNPGKVRLVYRNFPLSMHKMGSLAAAVGEAAADEGKFWEYAIAIMATGENMQTSDRVFEIAQSVGLDTAKIKKTLADENSPAMERLTRDINAADTLGITMTPTFLVQAKGVDTQAYSYASMMDAFENGPYKKYFGKG